MPSLNTGNAILSNPIKVDSSYNVGIGGAAMSTSKLTITDGTSISAYLKATNTNTAARDWAIITNNANFGDFAIRQGNSQGADATTGTNRLLISASGAATFSTDITGGGDLIFNKATRTTIYPSTTNQNLHIKSNGTGVLQFNNDNTGNLTMCVGGGNVGVGTNDPASDSLLHLSKNVTNLNLYLQNTNGSGKTWAVNSDNAGKFNIHDTTANRLTITSIGNIGIGTTSASYMLDILSTQSSALRVYQNINSDNYVRIDNTSTGTSATSRVDIGVNANSYALTLQKFGLNYSGTLFGVSCTNSSAIWDNSASSNGLFIGAVTSTPIIFGTSNSERMRITSGGNVGIGATPVSSVKLAVAGGIALGNYTDGVSNLSYGGRISAKLTTVTGGAGATLIHRALGSVGYFILVSGIGPSSSNTGRFADLVFGTGLGTPNVIASGTGGTGGPTRTYSMSGENLAVSLSGGDTWTITTTGLGAMEA